MYKGVIIEESLSDKSVLQEFEIVNTEISEEGVDWQEKTWHKHTIIVPEDEVEKTADKLSKSIKESWYIHLWKGMKMIVIFKGRKFHLKKSDTKSIKEAINCGLSVGIPEHQLEFEELFK